MTLYCCAESLVRLAWEVASTQGLLPDIVNGHSLTKLLNGSSLTEPVRQSTTTGRIVTMAFIRYTAVPLVTWYAK